MKIVDIRATTTARSAAARRRSGTLERRPLGATFIPTIAVRCVTDEGHSRSWANSAGGGKYRRWRTGSLVDHLPRGAWSYFIGATNPVQASNQSALATIIEHPTAA